MEEVKKVVLESFLKVFGFSEVRVEEVDLREKESGVKGLQENV